MDTTQILKIQEELAQRTLETPSCRHKRLYRLVCDEGWLHAGLEAVFTNRGSNTPGVDGVTKGLINMRKQGRSKLVKQLSEQLREEAYRPQPVKRVYIPKANGKKRPLGIAIPKANYPLIPKLLGIGNNHPSVSSFVWTTR